MVGLPRSGTTWFADLLIENFDCGVCIQFKHSAADNMLVGRKLAPELLRAEGGSAFSEAIIARDAVAVVMKKRFSDWWESVQRPATGIRSAVIKNAGGEGVLKDENVARKFHENYYAQWESAENNWEYNFLVVPYERALGEPEAVLFELVDKYQIPPKSDTWNLRDTWLSGPRREKYLVGTRWEEAT